MKTSATALLLAAALSVSAHPSGHVHQHFHRSPKPTDFYNSMNPTPPDVVDNRVDSAPEDNVLSTVADPVSQSKQYTPPVKVSDPVPPVKDDDNKSSGDSFGEGIGDYEPFCGGVGKRATVAEIHTEGNLGREGHYGCNVKLVKSNIADKYDYNMLFKNAGNSDQECACWLKISKTHGVDGCFKGKELFKFNLPAGGKQYVVVEDDSKGGCACQAGHLLTTTWGQYASTWVEYDMGSHSNQLWSGADASSLVAASQDIKIQGLKVCEATRPQDPCSIILPGGKGKNAYTKGTNDLDGIGLNLKTKQVRLEITVDYSE